MERLERRPPARRVQNKPQTPGWKPALHIRNARPCAGISALLDNPRNSREYAVLN